MPSIVPVSVHSRRFARAARVAVLVGCGVALAGCTGAVETFRSIRGFNKNDPDPVTAPFSGNIAAAETAPYPNLASVPPPPTRATTAAERQNLTEKLIAERAAAQAIGASAAAQPAAAQPAAAQVTAAEATPSAVVSQPPTAANEAPAAAVTGQPPAPTPEAPAHLATAAPQPAPAHSETAGEVPGLRRVAAGEPNPDLPRDSELQMPRVRSRPEPDDPRPAPPQPRFPPVLAVAPSQLPPAAIASADPQPPPSIPELAPIAPPPTPALATGEPPRAAAPTTVAMLDALDPGQLDPAQITLIAARYNERLGSQPPLRSVRVIAYTAPPAPGADPLGGYHDALQRAQGIAKVLTEAGIPAKMIQTEAKPASDPIAAARVEIQFLP